MVEVEVEALAEGTLYLKEVSSTSARICGVYRTYFNVRKTYVWPRQRSGYSDSLWVGRSRDRVRFFHWPSGLRRTSSAARLKES